MSRITTLAIGLAAALTLPAFAQDAVAPDSTGQATEAQEAQTPVKHGQRHAKKARRSQHWQRDGRKSAHSHFGQRGRMMGPMMMMMGPLMADFDADGDGVVTRAEVSKRLDALVEKHDTDGDGALSLDEFAALHAELMRPLTVRAFQWIDTDGDGEISEAERARAEKRLTRRLPSQGPEKPAEEN